MFESLTDSLNNAFRKLSGKGFLTDADVSTAMREVRIALLEADVSLLVVKDFITKVKEKAVGEKVVKSVSPAQMVVKIVHDELTNMLGSDTAELNLNASPPVVILMAGLQGSGKTTSCGKLALRLKDKQHKRVLMASLDVYRPAAQEQLATLGAQLQIDTLPIVAEEKPEKITKRALKTAKLEAYDVLILDTAGRLQIDVELMAELQAVKKLANPAETLLVADALTGQEAVNIADTFHKEIGITGLMLTRMDGDGRGGAALSMKAATGCPVKFLGVGEKPSELEVFHPDRVAGRILDKGDVVSLVEKASEVMDQKEAEKLTKKLRKGKFDFEDLAKQLRTMRKMGGFGGLMGLLPGIGKLKDKMNEAGVDDGLLNRQMAFIDSMTVQERRNPALLNGSRKKRIAAGAGGTVPELNRLIKQQKQMQSVIKKMGKMDRKSIERMAGQMGIDPNDPASMEGKIPADLQNLLK